MSELIDLAAKPQGERPRLKAILTGRIDTLTSRRGQYKLVLIGDADDMDQLVNTAKMQPNEELQLTIEEK